MVLKYDSMQAKNLREAVAFSIQHGRTHPLPSQEVKLVSGPGPRRYTDHVRGGERDKTMGEPSKIIHFGSLPRDPDRDALLVEMREPVRSLDELVFTPAIRGSLRRIEQEFRGRDAIAGLGLHPRSRLIFVGPPGCGKTVCAEALAGSLGMKLLYARFDGIVSSYLGETATNLRRVFTFAAQQNAILFFDEFDALGKRRDDPHEVGELKRVISSFLQILDAHPRDKFVVAASNHQGMLDEALWRRFDDVLEFPMPKAADLVVLLQLRLRPVSTTGLDLRKAAAKMRGFSFADAERVCHEAMKALAMRGSRELAETDLALEIEQQAARLKIVTKTQRAE